MVDIELVRQVLLSLPLLVEARRCFYRHRGSEVDLCAQGSGLGGAFVCSGLGARRCIRGIGGSEMHVYAMEAKGCKCALSFGVGYIKVHKRINSLLGST